jgi:tetratricopeptide (TPR) repeat protein
LANRSEDADAPFWEFYELTPHAKRAEYLSQWYLSQFDTTSANPGLDRELGAIGAHERPSREGEKRRYLLFREAEPDSPIPYAALARWYSTHRDFKTAREMLAEAEARVPAEKRDHPFYLAVSIVLHIELGEFDHATAAFERWPEPHRGFEYWRCRGLVLDEVLGQDEEAIAAYDQALQVWPGPTEWALRNRKANCLTRLGKTAEAEQVRADAAHVVSLMSAALHERLTKSLGHPDDPQQLMIVAKFYRDLGRTREAASWLQHIARLRSPSKTR